MLMPIGESHDMPTIIMRGKGRHEVMVSKRAPLIRSRAKLKLPMAAPMAMMAATKESPAYHSVNSGGVSASGVEPEILIATVAIYQRQNAEQANPMVLTIRHRTFGVVFMAWRVTLEFGTWRCHMEWRRSRNGIVTTALICLLGMLPKRVRFDGIAFNCLGFIF